MTEQTPMGALAQLRHLYQNMVNGGVRDTASAKRIAEGLLSPAIAALERGQPAGAGEPVAAHRVMRKRLDGEWVCDGRYWCDGPPSKELVESVCSDKDRWRVDVAHATPQPTQAQAGAVPLTAEQAQDLIDLESWGPEAIGLNAQLLRTIRRTETAHGIKGGQHGTE